MQQTFTDTEETDRFRQQLQKLKNEIQRLEQKTEKNSEPDNLPVYQKVERIGDAIGLEESDYTDSSDPYYKRPNADGWDKIFKWFRGNVENFEH